MGWPIEFPSPEEDTFREWTTDRYGGFWTDIIGMGKRGVLRMKRRDVFHANLTNGYGGFFLTMDEKRVFLFS